MRFNMGCGHNKLADWVNVDSAAACEPDQIWDLEQTPWPWPDNCATEVRFIHSLEHMGGEPKVFLGIMSELYRIAAPGCAIEIRVPHPRHDNFVNDPTHVRAITPAMLQLFDKELNDRWKAEKAANTTLAHYLGVDFQLTNAQHVLAAEYLAHLRNGTMTKEAIAEHARERLNVVEELRLYLLARKPAFAWES